MDARTLSLLLNTLYLCGCTCALSVPLGTFFAWLLWRTDLPARKIFLISLSTMIFVPLYLQAGAWQAGFGDQGWFTIVANSSTWLTGWSGVVWIHTMAALPWVVGIVGIGMTLIEPELEEQALLDGSAVQVFFNVTLRGALPAIGVAAIWVMVITAGEMTVTDLFGIRTYSEEVYTQAAATVSELDIAPPSVMLGIAITALMIVAGWALCFFLSPSRRPLTVLHHRTFYLKQWRWLYLLVTVFFFIIILGVPLGSLIYKAGIVVTQTEIGRIRSFSIGKCFMITFSSLMNFRRELGWTILIDTLSATAAVLTAIPLAWLLRNKTTNCNFQFSICNLQFAIILTFLALFLSLPGPILGLGIIKLLNQPSSSVMTWLYDRSILAPWLALYLRCLPIATLIMWHALQAVPKELIESAMVDGAGPIVRLWRIALPMCSTAAIVAWLAAFAISLGDLAASILVVPPGVTTISISIFGLLHYGVEDQAAGICLMMILVFAALAAMILRLVPGIARALQSE